ncbi:MAG: hypothetical protein ACOYCE_06115 [Limnochordia bacterium]
MAAAVQELSASGGEIASSTKEVAATTVTNAFKPYRVGDGIAPVDLPHHRAYGSVPRRFM